MNELTLVEKVLEQIDADITAGEFLPIEELLKNVPEDALKAYLPEFAGLYERSEA